MNLKDSIRYTNVISRKYRFYYSEMEQHLSDFMSDVFKCSAAIKGPLFYSINNIPRDEMVNAEFFMPMRDDGIKVSDSMHFHSYFHIDHMISVHDLTENAASTEAAYAKLFQSMESRYMRQVTPVFHIVSGDRSLSYLSIKIGVAPISSEEIWK